MHTKRKWEREHKRSKNKDNAHCFLPLWMGLQFKKKANSYFSPGWPSSGSRKTKFIRPQPFLELILQEQGAPWSRCFPGLLLRDPPSPSPTSSLLIWKRNRLPLFFSQTLIPSVLQEVTTGMIFWRASRSTIRRRTSGGRWPQWAVRAADTASPLVWSPV